MFSLCGGPRQRRFASAAVMMFSVLGLCSASLHAGTIGISVSPDGAGVYKYTYTISGFTLSANQDLDIQFDPAVYLALSNGVADSDFHLALLQPNNPPGTFGDYSIMALVNNPSLAGPFSVDVTLQQGVQSPPASQPFVIEQFSADGKFMSNIGSGTAGAVPEPPTGLMVLMAGAMTGYFGWRSRSWKTV